MYMKKIGAFLCAVFTAFVLAGAVESAAWSPSVAYAAKGGSFRSSGPRVSSPKPSNSVGTAKPSTGAPRSAAPGVNRGSGIGGVMRGIGIFAGGMMLGNLLSGMLGWSTMGGMSTIFGVLFNILFYGAIIKIVFWAIRSFFGRRKGGDPYHNNRMSYANINMEQHPGSGWDEDEVLDIRPPQHDKGGADYAPKRTADWYRRH